MVAETGLIEDSRTTDLGIPGFKAYCSILQHIFSIRYSVHVGIIVPDKIMMNIDSINIICVSIALIPYSKKVIILECILA